MILFKKISRKILLSMVKIFSLEKKVATFNKLVNPKVNNSKTKISIVGNFTDSNGRRHNLIKGLRDKIKPGWEQNLKEKDYSGIPSKDEILLQIEFGKNQIKELERLMAIHSIYITPKMDILEIGAAGGAVTYQIASKNPKSILGSDYFKYQANQSVSFKNANRILELESQHLVRLRNKIGNFFDDDILNKVSFIDDDICNSKINSESKDLILSWETLEHLQNPKNAFQEMYRILKPGGFAFHQYNPFFSFNGGHSLCTLDFMWGHVRLSAADFEKYLIQYRPEEHKLAMNFYKENLNRMTLNKLKIYIKKSGFKQIMLFPHTYFENYFELTEMIYRDCKKNYPTIEVVDLVSPAFYIGLKKPNS